MKKLNKNGFTLVELLAVIVIMGILMMVAIPSISRTIENSRKDTFMDIAKTYATSASTAWSADGIACGGTEASALAAGTYYIQVDSDDNFLLDQGGTSSWGNKPVRVLIKVVTAAGTDGVMKPKFYVSMSDDTHYVDGIGEDLEYSAIRRGNVKVDSGKKIADLAVPTGATSCVAN